MNEPNSAGTMTDPKRCPQCGAALPSGALEGLCPACLLQQGASADTATQPAMPPFEPPPIEEVARLFPQLEILTLLGKGGMGAVYQARQPALDRMVALKILPPQTAVGPAFADRFNREARALARLNHPNIVGVHDFGQAGGLHYFIMEFVDGVNLRQLECAGRLSPREALQIVPQICDALQYAHDEGVVHRDIKPENVLVDRKGRVKIADFGLAKILGREPADLRLTGEGQVMGTPHYMAPEQVEHPLEVDHRADIYSLGVVFYEMLTGELPLGKFAPPSRKVRVDVRLDEVVLHALEKEPERRYQQASEVKTDVQTIAAVEAKASAAAGGSAKTPEFAMRESVLRQVKGPAIGLLVTGIANWILIPLALLVVMPALTAAARSTDTRGSLILVVALAPLVLCSFIFFAAFKMMRLEAFRAAIAASVLAIVITPGNIIGLPLGIWALVTLSRREVRGAFKTGASGITANGTRIVGDLSPSTRARRRWWPWAVAVGILVSLAMVPGAYLLLRTDARRDAQAGRNSELLRRIGVPADLAESRRNKGVQIQAQMTHVQADGTIRFQTLIQVPNASAKPLTVYRFVSSDFADFQRILDAANRPVLFESSHVDRHFQYTLPLVPPVLPGETRSFISEGTMSGLVNPTAEPDVFEYRMGHTPGGSELIRRIEVHRLPKGAELVRFSPDNLRQQTNAGQIELSIDEIIPRGGSLEVRYLYRLAAERESAEQPARLKLRNAEQDLARKQALFADKILSQAELDEAKTARDVAQAELEALSGQDHAASTERWSPSLAPRPEKILDEARDLAAQGHYEEALQRHLWYHNHALEYDPAQVGVRLSFVLADWIELGRRYPKARQALLEIRDRKASEIRAGRGSFALFQDVAGINKYLNDDNATRVLFDAVRQADSFLAGQCFPVVEDLLVAQGEYALCLSFIPNREAKLDSFRRTWEDEKQFARDHPVANKPDFLKSAENRFVGKTRQLIEILVGAGRKAEAETIRDRALELLDDARLRSAVTDAENKVGQLKGPQESAGQARLEQAETSLARARTQLEQKQISLAKFEEARRERDRAASELLSNRVEIATARIRLQQAETVLARKRALVDENIMSAAEFEIATLERDTVAAELAVAEGKGTATDLARPKLRNTEKALERKRQLLRDNIIPQAEYDSAEADRVEAEAELAIAEGRSTVTELARVKLEQAERKLALKKKLLDDNIIPLAEYDGVRAQRDMAKAYFEALAGQTNAPPNRPAKRVEF